MQAQDISSLGEEYQSHDAIMATTVNFQNFAWSPGTVNSDLLPVDLATTRWLELLATDAAQADCTFSLAPSPILPSKELEMSSAYDLDSEIATNSRSDVSSDTAVASDNFNFHHPTILQSSSSQSKYDIVLQNDEAILFRIFAERAALWMDLFDPLKHFSTYVIRLAVSLVRYYDIVFGPHGLYGSLRILDSSHLQDKCITLSSSHAVLDIVC